MSGHIRKSRFNNNNNNKAVFIYSNKTSKKTFPSTRHTDHLTIPTLQTRPHTPDSFNPQIIKEKENRDFPVASLVRPPFSLLVDQSAFGPRGSKALHYELGSPSQKARSLFHQTFLLRSLLSSLSPRSSVHTRFLSSEAPPPWPASFSGPTPLLGVPPLSPPIGRADTPFDRQRDRWAFPQLCLADSLPDLSCILLLAKPSFSSLGSASFGGKPRRSRTMVLLWREFPAGNLAASPSIPWRSSCPHGARLMASAVCLMGWRCSELDGCCVEGAWQMM